MLLHAGPPIAWERVCDPQRRALRRPRACSRAGPPTATAAAALLAAGEVRLRSGNEHGHVGPMTGVCSPSMPVWVVEDEGSGARAFSTLNEGPGRTLWFGVGDDEAVERRALPARPRGPAARAAARAHGPDRRARPRRAGAADGRRAAHAQPGDDEPALAPAAAGLRRRGRRGRGRRADRPTTSSSSTWPWRRRSARRWPRGGATGSTLVTLMSRNGTDMGAAARRAAGALVHRAGGARPGRAAARGLRGRGRRARHRRLGGARVHRPGRHGGGGGARRGGVLRRRRGRRGGALAAHGRDLRRALGALHAPGARPRRQPGGDRRAARRRARA